MVSLTEAALSVAAHVQSDIIAADGSGWEIGNFFDNAQESVKTIGGGFLGLLGVACLIFSGTFLVQKLVSENSRRSWFTIIALLLIGGMLMVGGFVILQDIASGAQETIVELGN
ncbi:MAG: hypothetical protein LBO20_07035 [Bifidobacteriaceae bacterium]|jgi:hypothetical protein|nr:hypothetical protein [Bifidobacteriaceae bacterium]